MTDAEITQDVAEAFMYFYYDALVTDMSRLQNVLDQNCRLVYRTFKTQSRDSQYDIKKEPLSIIKTLETIYKIVTSVDILMWTPIQMDENVALIVSAQYKQRDTDVPLLANEVLILGKSRQKQKRGFTLLAITTHIIRDTSEVKPSAK